MNIKIARLYDNFENELHQISRSYSIPLPTILAVLQVETNDDDGFAFNKKENKYLLIIRFELHKFKKYCNAIEYEKVKGRFSFNKDKPWLDQKFRIQAEDEYRSFHGNQTNEYFVFDQCAAIDERAAYLSISMGLPQIMGFNYEAMQFNSPQEMYSEFSTGVMPQIESMMQFMGSSMRNALKKRRFVDFAYQYNGRGKAEDYGEKIRKAEAEIAAWYEG